MSHLRRLQQNRAKIANNENKKVSWAELVALSADEAKALAIDFDVEYIGKMKTLSTIYKMQH